MASAKKLPSGAWRCRPTKIINGEKVTRSFTVHPKDCGNDSKLAKKTAEHQADLWLFEKNEMESGVITVSDAIDRYNQSKEAVLSPSTMADYYRMKKYFDKILHVDIHDVTTSMIQSLIGDMAVMTNRYGKRLDTRTIKNRIFYLLAVLNHFEVNKQFKLTFPAQDEEKELLPPEKEEFTRLLDNCNNSEEKLILMLAGLYTLRRGEVCGLVGANILWDMHCIEVKYSRVQNKKKELVMKMPKTRQSIRTIEIDPRLMALFPEVGPDEHVISLKPNQVTKMFARVRKKACVDCRFHDLRKYAASIRSDMMGSKYVEADGGWKKGSKILSSIYDKPFKAKRHELSKKFNNMVMDDYGESLLG